MCAGVDARGLTHSASQSTVVLSTSDAGAKGKQDEVFHNRFTERLLRRVTTHRRTVALRDHDHTIDGSHASRSQAPAIA